ncbi:endo alpha-1,4 polygalactosaminidase [Stackebrandtia nassauensis]|uniref:Glycoside-hydrolase family GH114 TIM-barrel domain-containing protein n=1 Tax=Stackebrandtia nassauensis (strain DSM 44728 / CIP 108903 / NRRL B-16338 / NBRC 102104 / LLR-40K-21) TaxID=446470 RepID=D3Q0R4_STANL|nr:endo alpha-1,4 polygalactosaminidase [Stackebrandtia nassauensis]ADD41800.1 hypothetical protein Snas_2106 [Stackebrandtia nassauensis DSM 44728]
MRGSLVTVAVAVSLLAGCTSAGSPDTESASKSKNDEPTTWVYQLEGYPDGTLDEIVKAPHEAAVIDLARDGGDDYFSKKEITEVKDSGKTTLSYFSMGSIEKYRPEYDDIAASDLMLNRWDDWPDENFVKYWEDEWWDKVVRPRLDLSMEAGFDGAYLDVPNAYEDIDLDLVPGETRESLGRKMTDLIIKISEYTKKREPDFMVLPQNSPELREFDGYMDAIDGLGVEDLFFLDSDKPCTEEWCEENLNNVRAIREAGKLVLSVDYASEESNIEKACEHYAEEDFAGYVSVVELDRIKPPCP